MQPGRFDRKISIEHYTTTKNKFGETVKTWALFAEAWAGTKGQSSKEVFQNDQLQNINTLIFNTRFLPGITSKMRIIFEGQIFNIRGVQEIGRRKGLQIVGEDSGEYYVAPVSDNTAFTYTFPYQLA